MLATTQSKVLYALRAVLLNCAGFTRTVTESTLPGSSGPAPLSAPIRTAARTACTPTRTRRRGDSGAAVSGSARGVCSARRASAPTAWPASVRRAHSWCGSDEGGHGAFKLGAPFSISL